MGKYYYYAVAKWPASGQGFLNTTEMTGSLIFRIFLKFKESKEPTQFNLKYQMQGPRSIFAIGGLNEMPKAFSARRRRKRPRGVRGHAPSENF